MDSILNSLALEKKDFRAAILWGAVLLVILVLLRGNPVNDVYYLLVNIWDFVTHTFVFLEAAFDVLAYVLMLLLLACLAFAVIGVLRAWGHRRQQSNYC